MSRLFGIQSQVLILLKIVSLRRILKLLRTYNYFISKITVRFIEMHKRENVNPTSPDQRYPNDSLVFSVTGEKEFPLHQMTYEGSQEKNIFLEMNDEHISKEILQLNSKINALQGKVDLIQTDLPAEQENINTLNKPHFTKPGKIKKRYSCQKSFHNANNSFLNRTGLSCASHQSELKQKEKVIRKMNRQINIVKNLKEISQKSQRKYSQQLSKSKRSVKKFKVKEAHLESIIKKLRRQLEKSQNIRRKQKEIICSQKEEIKELKRMNMKAHQTFCSIR